MPERRQASSAAMAQLAKLAETEAAQMKERHRARDTAIRRYESALSTLKEAERAMAAARQEQAAAVGALLATGLDSKAVAALLGVDARRVREARGREPKATETSGTANAGAAC